MAKDKMKTVKTVDDLGERGKKALDKLVQAGETYQRALDKYSVVLARFLAAMLQDGIVLTQDQIANIAHCHQTYVGKLLRAIKNLHENGEKYNAIPKIVQDLGSARFIAEYAPAKQKRVQHPTASKPTVRGGSKHAGDKVDSTLAPKGSEGTEEHAKVLAAQTYDVFQDRAKHFLHQVITGQVSLSDDESETLAITLLEIVDHIQPIGREVGEEVSKTLQEQDKRPASVPLN